MADSYSREKELQEKLNLFLTNNLDLPDKDYYSNLNAGDFLQLKSVLSDINNILTLKITLSFARWAANHFNFNPQLKDTILTKIINTKPNANGYDIEISAPVKFIAEVKCNIPIKKGTTYGSAQRLGINKDIAALINGKNKSAIKPYEYYKFMVFLDNPEVKKATEHFVSNMKKNKNKVVFAADVSSITNTDNVYIVYAKI